MKLLPLAIVQSLLLAGGQVFLKLALGRIEPFGWCWAVLTAKEDGVRYVLDRVRDETELDFRFAVDYGALPKMGRPFHSQ